MDNPYRAPTANVGQPPATGNPVKAILLGAAVDIGGTLVATTVAGVVYGIYLAASQEPVTSFAEGGTRLWIAGMVLGCGFSILGGYVCARIARHRELRLGAILSAISMLIGLLIGAGSYSVEMNAWLAIATVASIMVGAWLGKLRNTRDTRVR